MISLDFSFSCFFSCLDTYHILCTIPTCIAMATAKATRNGVEWNACIRLHETSKECLPIFRTYRVHARIKGGWNSDISTNEIIWHSNTIIVQERQCNAMQCMHVIHLYSRTFPRIPLNLHHSRLFMRESHFAFFVEAVLLEITDNPRHDHVSNE